MLDARVIESTENAELVLGAVEKDAANPLFRVDRPWENSLNNLYPNVLYDGEDHLYKLWYKCVLADEDAIAKMGDPSTVHDVGWYLLYATSKDGRNWIKPDLGLFGFDGSKKNNVVARDTPNVGVFKDARSDCEPDRRYKMIYGVGRGNTRVRFLGLPHGSFSRGIFTVDMTHLSICRTSDRFVCIRCKKPRCTSPSIRILQGAGLENESVSRRTPNWDSWREATSCPPPRSHRPRRLRTRRGSRRCTPACTVRSASGRPRWRSGAYRSRSRHV